MKLDDLVSQTKARPFVPKPFYDVANDFLTFYVENCKTYGVRIDDVVTLYLAVDSDRLVGCQIKGVRRLLADREIYKVTVADNQLTLGLVFLSLVSFNPGIREMEEKFAEFTRRVPLDAPLLEAA